MNKTMKNLAHKIFLLLMAGIMYSACSNYGDDDLVDANYAFDASSDDNAINIIKEMAGEYSGEWTMNGVKVVADSTINRFSLCFLGYNGMYSFTMTTFPFSAISIPFLPQTFLPYYLTKITTELPLGTQPEKDEQLLFKTMFLGDGSSTDASKEDYSTRLTGDTETKCIGYSQNLVYLELKPYQNYAFLRYPFVMSFSDGSYFALVLAVAPSKSTVTLDNSTKTMNFVCNIPKIEYYDSEGHKSIVEMAPAMTLTFTSTKKTRNRGNGN